jgi:hypothetical protein
LGRLLQGQKRIRLLDFTVARTLMRMGPDPV